MKIGDIVKYNGTEWCVVAVGTRFIRLERGHGPTWSSVVVQPEEVGS